MGLGNLIVWAVVGALIGIGTRAFLVHNRQLSVALSAAVGAATSFVSAAILGASPLPEALDFIFQFAFIIQAVLFAASRCPRPTISHNPMGSLVETSSAEPPRSQGGQSTTVGAMSDSGQRPIQEFDVSSVMFYDGTGHRLGPSRCALTSERLIIDDARGGVHQILLRDISGLSTPGRLVSPSSFA